MPRKAKGPRLYLRERPGRDPVYVVLDTGGYEESTGCGPAERAGAEKALARYLGKKHSSAVGTHDPAALPIADLLNFYAEAKDPGETAPKGKRAVYGTLLIMVEHLITFFGSRPTTEIRGATCRDYVRWRTHEGPAVKGWPERRERAVSDQTARRELVSLGAAIGRYHKEYTLDMVPAVTLPDMAPTKRRALTHSEAAALLAGALGFYRDENGKVRRRDKLVRALRKRTARFILIALYSGTRHSAITAARWLPSTDAPWIDVDRGILYRRGDEENDTGKRRPTAKIPPRLLAHLRRWRKIDMEPPPMKNGQHGEPNIHVLARAGKPLSGQLRKGWASARSDAGLPSAIVPHVLRHTAATWLAQGGASARQAGDYLGMTEATFEKRYYHQHPAYQEEIGLAFDRAQGSASKLREQSRAAPKNAQGTRQKP